LILAAHGLRVELPRGWSGRVYLRDQGIATLHAGDFQIALGDASPFGGRSTSKMPAVASFVALTEYLPGRGLRPGSGLFVSRRIPLPLDPTSFSGSRLDRPRPGHAGMQHFFTTGGRPFCLYVVIAGGRATRAAQLAGIDRVLRSLRITRRQ
jgi:hypothetical protein